MVARPSAPHSPSPSSGRITVPKQTRDPISSLKPWPVELILAGAVYRIEPLPAVEWLSVLMADDIDILDFYSSLMCNREYARLYSLLQSNGLQLEELEQMTRDVVEVSSARPWWIALRLVGIARENWNVLGPELMFKRIDAQTASLSGWLDALLIVILRQLEEKDVTQFLARLEMPPPEEVEQVRAELEASEMSREAFLALMK